MIKIFTNWKGEHQFSLKYKLGRIGDDIIKSIARVKITITI